MPRKAMSAKGVKTKPSLPELEPQPTLTNGEGSSSEASDGRARNGTFTMGNSFGPGNPHARHCARMLALLRTSISDDEMVAIIRALVEKASAGETSAAKILLSYKIGKPAEAPNPDQIDRDEWEHYQKDTINLQEMQQVLSSLPAKVGNDIARTALPIMTEARTRELETQLRKGCSVSQEVNESTEDADEKSQNAQPLPNGNSSSGAPSAKRSTTNGSQSSTLSDSARRSRSSRLKVRATVPDSRSTTNDHRESTNDDRLSINDSRSTLHAPRSTPPTPLSNGKSRKQKKGKSKCKRGGPSPSDKGDGR